MQKSNYAQAINDEILAALSLKNRYSFLNNNLTAILSQEEFNFLRKVERFCQKYEKKKTITHGPEEDIYEWVSDFGKEGYISRQHNFTMCDVNYEYYGLAADLMRSLALDMFDPQSSLQSVK